MNKKPMSDKSMLPIALFMFAICGFVAWAMFPKMPPTPSTPNNGGVILENSVVMETEDETIFRYKSFQEMPVELLLDANSGELCLRILLDDYTKLSDYEYVEFLESEVNFLVSQEDAVELGTTGYRLLFIEGEPMWNLQFKDTADGIGYYHELCFSIKAEIINTTIVVYGSNQ